jgi:hypothetical protein
LIPCGSYGAWINLLAQVYKRRFQSAGVLVGFSTELDGF